MTKYPLTYAVFYRSLIEPFTQLNQYDINHILFAGDIGIDETHPDYISRVLGNGYVSGNKTIRKEFTKRIAMLTPSELVSRIQMLGLLDLPLVLSTAKKLILISDVSVELQSQLLTKADTVDSELFIAELFQQSLRCHNQKLKLNAEHKKYLSTLSTAEIKSEQPKKTIDTRNLFSILADSPLDITQTNNEDSKTEIDKLLDHYYKQYEEQKLGAEEKDYATWRKVNLPDDMDYFLRLIAPILFEPGIINLDYADVITISHIDFESKVYKTGHVEVLEMSCPADDLSLYENALSQIRNCKECLIQFTVGPDCGMIEIEEMTKTLQYYLHPEAYLLFGANINDTLENRYNIILICHYDDPTEGDVLSAKDIEDVVNSYLTEIKVEPPTKTKPTEIQIPNVFKR